MASVLWGLVAAQLLRESCLSVSGTFFLEVFAGEAVFTLGCMMHRVPCIRPWDVVYGSQFDVLANEHVLSSLIVKGLISCMHFGTPCQSMTLARLPQLRSWEFPMGVPNLTTSQLALVHLGNELMQVSARLISLLVAACAYFSLENPSGSWLWALGPIVSLWLLSGVIFTEVRYNAFGVNYVKPTGFLHNMPTLARLAVESPPFGTNEMVVLRGKV